MTITQIIDSIVKLDSRIERDILRIEANVELRNTVIAFAVLITLTGLICLVCCQN
jgi:hypothetical protein